MVNVVRFAPGVLRSSIIQVALRRLECQRHHGAWIPEIGMYAAEKLGQQCLLLVDRAGGHPAAWQLPEELAVLLVDRLGVDHLSQDCKGIVGSMSDPLSFRRTWREDVAQASHLLPAAGRRALVERCRLLRERTVQLFMSIGPKPLGTTRLRLLNSADKLIDLSIAIDPACTAELAAHLHTTSDGDGWLSLAARAHIARVLGDEGLHLRLLERACAAMGGPPPHSAGAVDEPAWRAWLQVSLLRARGVLRVRSAAAGQAAFEAIRQRVPADALRLPGIAALLQGFSKLQAAEAIERARAKGRPGARPVLRPSSTVPAQLPHG